MSQFTDNALMVCANIARSTYSQGSDVPEDLWPPMAKTQYINLALVKTSAFDFKDNYTRYTIKGSIDDIWKSKDEITYSDAFQEGKAGSRILLEGRPGCGKTTLTHKISQDWAKGDILKESVVLLFVKLRIFFGRADIELKDILQLFCPDNLVSDLCCTIHYNGGDGVCFALDGLDEYYTFMTRNCFLYKLIKGEVLPNAVVIVASRPSATQPFRRNVSRRVEVLGFLEDQIYEYIDDYFEKDKQKAKELTGFLRHHPNIKHICYIPLHVAMVTYLFEQEGSSLPATETEIYRHFIIYTLLRAMLLEEEREQESLIQQEIYLRSFKDMPSCKYALFQLICKHAFEATVQSKQIFLGSEMKNLLGDTHDTNSDSLGLLTVDRQSTKYGFQKTWSFVHLTFQEFLAACYISELVEKEQLEIINSHSRLHVVLKFVCGLCEYKRPELPSTVKRIVELNVSHQRFLLHCAYESQNEEVSKLVVTSCNGVIELNKETLNPFDCASLGYVAANCVSLKELTLSNCTISAEGFEAFKKEVHGGCVHASTLK